MRHADLLGNVNHWNSPHEVAFRLVCSIAEVLFCALQIIGLLRCFFVHVTILLLQIELCANRETINTECQ